MLEFYTHSTTCNKCGAVINYNMDYIGFLECGSCSNKMNPFDLRKINCYFCNRVSYFLADWDSFMCSYCNNMIYLDDAVMDLKIKEFEEEKKVYMQEKKNNGNETRKSIPNPYMIYCKINRRRMSEEFPEMNFGEIGSKLGESWKNLDDNEKRVYKEIYERERRNSK